jgi:DNA end-binding protein Ku
MPRAIWKGAVSFGLVNIPIALYPAAHSDDIDFEWLDKRTLDPVGYKRINKRTGKEIEKENIVKGVKQGDGKYVALSDDEIRQALPRTTQTIEIEAFVGMGDVPFYFLERPYYLEPVGKSQKVYALLREAMLKTGVIGIARVVMHNKEHLAALIPMGTALMLDTLRWADEIRPPSELDIPSAGRSASGIKDAELKMACDLVRGMTRKWTPEDYKASFVDAIQKLIAQKVKAGKARDIEPLEEAPEKSGTSNVIDLTALLKRSLGETKGARPGAGTKRGTSRTGSKTAARKRA